MAKKIKEIDIYITKSAEFAKPILQHIRELVHQACPNVEEKIRWGFPHFDYKNDMMCSMAAFKKHSVMGFWKAALMKNSVLLDMAGAEQAMGHLGKMTCLQHLPPDKKLIAYIREAMEINELGLHLPARPKTVEKEPLVVPEDFKKALAKTKKHIKPSMHFPTRIKKNISSGSRKPKRKSQKIKEYVLR